MTTYTITAPDGKEYDVTGSGTKEEALSHFQTQWKANGGKAPQSPGWKQTIGDVGRIAADTMTRGFGDKISDTISGGHEQADTAAARERQPWYVEFPTDVAAGIASSPYRVGSAVAGAGIGGVEGFANAYAHQKNWLPHSWGEAGDLAKGTVMGAGGGALGYGLGDVVGRYGSQAVNWARQGYKSDKALEKAITSGKIRYELPEAQQTLKNVEDIRKIQKTSRMDREAGLKGERGKAELQGYVDASGTDLSSPQMLKARSMLERADAPPSNVAPQLAKTGGGLGTTGGGLLGAYVGKTAGLDPRLAGGIGMAALGTAGYFGGGTVGKAIDAVRNAGRGTLKDADFNELAAIIRDRYRNGYSPNQKAMEVGRDMLSKTMMTGSKERNY